MGRRRPFSLISLFLSLSWCLSPAQTKPAENHPSRITVVPTTLWMDWTRGDLQYGRDFIALHAPCENQDISECECNAAFKATRTKEFADYITSFPHGKVPVVYNVWRNPDGRIVGVTLVRVGERTNDRTHPNDGLLGVGHTFKSGRPRQKESWKARGLENCFPSRSGSRSAQTP